MMPNMKIKALAFEESGELRCGNCGKKLLCYEQKKRKKGKNSQKSVDNSENYVIIYVKCGRCGTENTASL